MLEIKNCCKVFGDQTVLQDVSLNIHDGSIIGVSGASGIGKSTLAKILCGVMPPDAGEVSLDGKLLVSPKEAYDRKRGLAIQMVYQQPYATLDPSQKIGAGLRELISYHHLAENKKAAETLIADILAQMQLPPKILAHLPRQISGGEAQRVALARCLLLRPLPGGECDLSERRDAKTYGRNGRMVVLPCLRSKTAANRSVTRRF